MRFIMALILLMIVFSATSREGGAAVEPVAD
jgi:hypothetical protein